MPDPTQRVIELVHRLDLFGRTAVRLLRKNAAIYWSASGSRWRTVLFLANYARNRLRLYWQGRWALRSRDALVAAVRDSSAGADAPLIGILVTGGIGDCVVAARFLRDLVAGAEPLRFDVYCSRPQAAAWAFAAVPGFRAAHSNALFDQLRATYDLALWISQFIVVFAESAGRAKLDRCGRLMRAVTAMTDFRSKIEPAMQHTPFLDGHLARQAYYMNLTRETFLHAMAAIPYGGPRLDLATQAGRLTQLGLLGRPYVTIGNGFDRDVIVTHKIATKCYPHGDELVRLFKARFPDVAVVHIGTSGQRIIAGVDVNLVARTTLPEVAAILAGARLHIDNEGGLVHIAKALGTRSCVIFGPTSFEYFAYPDNINIRPTFCGGCWWTTPTWMDLCPRGFATARCMSEQAPTSIVAAIAAAWDPRAGNPPLAANVGAAPVMR